MLGQVARGDAGINQRLVLIVHPEPNAVGCLDDELVITAFVREERTTPRQGELVGCLDRRICRSRGIGHDLGERVARVKIETHQSIDTIERLPVGHRPPRFVITAHSALRSRHGIGPAKLFDEIGDGVDVLPVGQPHELDTRRMIPCPGFARIKRLVDVTSHRLGVRAHTLLGLIVRHILVDVTREFLDRPVAVEGLVVFALHSFAVFPVAFDTLLPINVASAWPTIGGCELHLAPEQQAQGQPGE